MKTKIIEWYKKEVPTDTQADELIRPNATFMDLLEKLYKGEDVYDLFDDSLIRETCFSHLCELTGRNYDYFYNLWLEGGVKRRENERSTKMNFTKEEIEYIYYDLICFRSDWLLDHGYSRSKMLISLMDKFEKELKNEDI